MTTRETMVSAIPVRMVRVLCTAFLSLAVILVMLVSVSLALDGTDGDDVLTNPSGTTEADINGLAGNDIITNNGTVTNDIDGGPGNDTITNAGTVDDNIYGSNNYGVNSSGGDNTITNAGTVNGYIYGSYNEGDNSSGGSNTITNSGTVDWYIYGSRNQGANSSGANNTITNSGTVNGYIYGSYNRGVNSSGGDNTITNSGTVNEYIYGSFNWGAGSSGGSNTITNTNSGIAEDIYGSRNQGVNSTGGNNTITNSGTVNDDICGSRNSGAGSSGGSNTITNSGRVDWSIFGSHNWGANSSGGDNTITNSGRVDYRIYGSYNRGASSTGGDNTITNSGRVNGYIYGSYNEGDNSSGGDNTITNSGTVTGFIYGSYNSGAGSTGGNNTITNSGTVGGGIYGSSNSVVGNTLELVGACHVGGSIINFERFLKTGPGTATVGGTLNLNGVTQTRMQGYAGSFPLIDVTGNAALDGTLEPFGYFPTGTNILIQSGGLGGSTFAGLIDNSAVLDFTLDYTGGNNASLVVTRRSYTHVVPGLSGNDWPLAGALSAAAHNASGDLAYVIGVLDFLSLPDMAAALNQLWPTTLSALHETSFNNGSRFIHSAMRRLQDLRNGFYTAKDTTWSFANAPPILLASAADISTLGLVQPSRSSEYDLGVFADVVGSGGNRNEVSEHPGYQYDTAGFVLGLDHAFIPGLIGGLDVGYVFSGIDYKDVGDSRGTVDTLHAGIYGTRFFEHWHIDAAVSGGYNWYESGRRIVFGAVNRTAEADFSGWLLDAHLGGGYDFEPGGFIITPQAAIDYALLHTNGYTEHGAGALDLDVDAVDTHSLATSLGATIAYPFEMIANVTVVPSISAAWQHEFLGDKDDIRTYLIGAPSGGFYIDTAGPDPDSALIGVALLLQGEQVSFDMRYDAKLSSHLDAHHFNAELRYVF